MFLTFVCVSQDEEEAGLLELLKSQICDNAALYAQKYDEEFQPYLPRFVTAIWNLLVSTGQEVKYDLVRTVRPDCFCYFWSSLSPYLQFTLSLLQLVSNAIQFLASVCERPHYKHLFEDQNTLTSICEKVIVPNMEFRSKPSNYTWKCLEIQVAACLDTHMLMCWVSLTRLTFNVGLGADEEAFEDNSEEYIRRDLEGSGKNASPSLKLNLNEQSFDFYLI